MEDERARAIESSVRALARRDHSAASLRAKLERAGISEAAQTEALATLERAGYVDDARFARDRAARLAGRGYGDEWIRADLAAQGVGAEASDEALAVLEPEAERAVREAGAVGGGVRAARVLARKGFSEDSIEALVGRTVAEEPRGGVG